MSNALIQEFNKDNMKEDLITMGFHKLDDNLVDRRAPKIGWGKKYKASTPQAKIEYLEKLCSTMNHAAFLIQNERNELVTNIDLKERQIAKAKQDIDANLKMIETQITEINSYKQKVNKSMADKNKTITDLKKEIRLMKNGGMN